MRRHRRVRRSQFTVSARVVCHTGSLWRSGTLPPRKIMCKALNGSRSRLCAPHVRRALYAVRARRSCLGGSHAAKYMGTRTCAAQSVAALATTLPEYMGRGGCLVGSANSDRATGDRDRRVADRGGVARCATGVPPRAPCCKFSAPRAARLPERKRPLLVEWSARRWMVT